MLEDTRSVDLLRRDPQADQRGVFQLPNGERIRQADPEDRPVPVTFRKQEALHRLSDRVKVEDVRMDPETGELDADVIESGSSQSQHERLKFIKDTIAELAKATENGAPVEDLMEVGREEGFTELQLEHGIDKLKKKGEIYESHPDHLRVSPL